MTIHVSIGNSDDKLRQIEWSHFCNNVDMAVRRHALVVHGYWLSHTDAAWQNACWAFEVAPERRDLLRKVLVLEAETFRQDSIAWVEGDTEFLRPDGVEP